MGIRLSIFISDRVDTALAGLEPWNSASQKLQEAFTTTPGCLYPIMKGSGFSWEVVTLIPALRRQELQDSQGYTENRVSNKTTPKQKQHQENVLFFNIFNRKGFPECPGLTFPPASPLVFRDRASLYSPGCPGTHSVDQAGLELWNPPASASKCSRNLLSRI